MSAGSGRSLPSGRPDGKLGAVLPAPRRNTLSYCASLADESKEAIVEISRIRWRTAAYDFNFSISAMAPAGALTFPSWMK